MAFNDRSYSGKLFRPSPEVHIEEDGSLGVIATPWGGRQGARKVIDLMRDYVQSARQDMEATSPFQKLSCLSPLANNLRVAIMLANDALYREDNKSEYTSGVEVLAFAHSNNELAFAQVGLPHFLLSRKGLPWIPLSVQIDLSTEMSQPPNILPPLPQNLLGLHTTSNMNISSFRTQPGDRLIFLSHSVASHPLYTHGFDEATLEKVSSTLSEKYPDLPFWLGVLDL